MATARNATAVVAAIQAVRLTPRGQDGFGAAGLLLGAQPQHGGDDEAGRDDGHEHVDVAQERVDERLLGVAPTAPTTSAISGLEAMRSGMVGMTAP